MVEAFHNALKTFLRLLVASLKEATLDANIDKLMMQESEARGSLRLKPAVRCVATPKRWCI